MDDKGSGSRHRGRRNDIPWQDVREAHAAGMTETAQLAKRFGISERAIRNRRNAEKWPTSAEMVQLAAHKVIDLHTRRAIERVGDQVEDAIAQGLLRHAEIEMLLLDVAKASLEKAKSGDFSVIAGRVTDAECVEMAVNAAGKAIDKSREIHGLRPGTPSMGDERKTQVQRIEFVDAVEQTA